MVTIVEAVRYEKLQKCALSVCLHNSRTAELIFMKCDTEICRHLLVKTLRQCQDFT
jgi:hypothetical protein